MSKLDKEKYRDQRSGKQKLTAEMVPTPNVLLTVASVAEVPESDKVKRAFLALTFEEYPDFEWTTNKEQSDLLVRAVEAGHLSEEMDEWVGKVIPMHKVENTNPTNKQKVKKLYPYDPEEWEGAIEQARAAAKAGAKGKR